MSKDRRNCQQEKTTVTNSDDCNEYIGGDKISGNKGDSNNQNGFYGIGVNYGTINQQCTGETGKRKLNV